MKKTVLSIIGIAISVIAVFPQTSSLPNVMLPSPSSMQFQKYGDYPVHHFTGVPDITIPIYTINEGDLQVPITLSYHASGCRVDDVSGFVGLGWSLNIGGMITRTVYGFPDEGDKAFMIPSQKAQNIQFWDQPTAILLDDLDNGIYYDHEYDIYSYNFLGKSGKWIIDYANARIFPIQFTNMNLEYAPNVITDENGIEYRFGGDATEYTTYTDAITTVERSATTTFPLESIKSAKDPNNSVSYFYQPGPLYRTNITTNRYSFDDYWENNLYYFSDNIPNSLGSGTGGVHESVYQMNNYTFVPKEILFNSGKIEFIQDTTTKMLKRIEILDYNNILVKKIVFNVENFAGNAGYDALGNYKLESIHFTDTANKVVEKYSFNYFNENDPYAKPNAYSLFTGRDYWGFYNGHDGILTRLGSASALTTLGDPGQPTPVSFNGGAVKTPSEYHTKAYVLNKITYPTGGYTVFDFEGNKTTNNQAFGGLRIKTISSYTNNNELAAQKNYYYLSATAEIIPNDEMFITTSTGDIGPGHVFDRKVSVTENLDLDLSPQGASVVYPVVAESNGKDTTFYSYDYDSAYTYESLEFPAMQRTTTDPYYFKRIANNYKPWSFGNLLERSNSIEGEVNEYEEFVKDTLRDFVMERWMTPECLINWTPTYQCNSAYMSAYDYTIPTSHNLNVFNYADRYYYSSGKRLKKTTTRYQSNGSSVVSVREYFYDNSSRPTMPTRITTINSEGETITTSLKYPFDFSSFSPYDEMIARNIISPVIEQKQVNTTLNKELTKVKTNYSLWESNTIIQPVSIEKSLLGNSLETEATINSYDDNGNILQTTGKDGIVTSYIWGYGRRYPVAKISGKSYTDAVSQSGINLSVVNNPASENALRTELDKLRTLPGAFASTYTYKVMIGISSETDARGQTIYYEYDAAGILSVVRDEDSNILKRYTYSFFDASTQSQTAPQWQNSGTSYCELCPANSNYNTGRVKVQQVDNNPQSYTYNQQRWTDQPSDSCMSASPNWAGTGNFRCKILSNGQNTGTGEQEREEIGMNPCLNLNQIRWVTNGTNLTACPAPPFFTCEDNSGPFTKNDCSDLETGSTINVSIPPGTATSTISLADANYQAQIYGQNYANQHGTCSLQQIILEFNAQITGSSVAYDIYLTNANNSSLTYTFTSSSYGVNNLGVLPAGYYDIAITPVTSTTSIQFEAGCSHFQTGASVNFYNIKLNNNCKRITASE